ncbi:MAG: autotransporter-associated beta strand repeat-containing protein, partial [Planctomycetales bacterium]|nr:autotransporter-associated beta strand repeat-containing protein [Planctomycetales bacterium]
LDLNGQTGITTNSLLLASGASSNLINSNTSTAASYAKSISLNNNTPNIGGAGDMTLSGVLSNGGVGSNGGFTKIGAGTLTLSGANTYAGVTTFESGVVNATALSNYGVSGSLGNRSAAQDVPTNIGLLFRGGTLQYTGGTATSTDRAIRVSTVGGAFLDASGSVPTATMSFTRTAASPDFYENSGNRQITFTGTNTGANTFAMPIQSTGGLTTVNKTGSGRWVLTGASTYSGPTNIQAGVLQIENSTALGAGTFSTNDWTVISNGASLHLNGNLAVTEHFRLQGNGADGLGAIRSLSGTSSISQAMGLDGTTQFGVDAGSQLTIVNTIYSAVGTPGLTKSGLGTLILSGANSYNGGTNINGGTL